jgi:hypothetical protein
MKLLLIYYLFFCYFSLRNLLSNKKKTTVDRAVDRFNHVTNRCFGSVLISYNILYKSRLLYVTQSLFLGLVMCVA